MRLLRAFIYVFGVLSLISCAGPSIESTSVDAPIDESEEVVDSGLRREVPVGTKLLTTAAIYFREGPGRFHPSISILPQGAAVETVQGAPVNRYYNVRYQGTVGWASGSYLRLAPVPSPAPAPVDPAPVDPTPVDPIPTEPSNATGGTGGALTDSTFLSFSNSRYTSKYHLYAAGLDWTKPVGLLVYCDGSGEYGLKNPSSTYLLAGSNGLINVAKRNNMILLTPFAPNPACSDGDGSCWYMGDPTGYAQWSRDLTKYIESRYNIALNRVALGGYSSGAQWLTEYFVPGGHADAVMTDGVGVAISYGGSPKVSTNNTAIMANTKARVHFNWNTGDKDTAYTGSGSYGVMAGYTWYSQNGFSTSLDVIAGLDHSRSDFGLVMEKQIRIHLP